MTVIGSVQTVADQTRAFTCVCPWKAFCVYVSQEARLDPGSLALTEPGRKGVRRHRGALLVCKC